MKKSFSLLLALALAFSLVFSLSGCIPSNPVLPTGDEPDNIYTCTSDGDQFVLTLDDGYTKIDRGSYVELTSNHYLVMVDPMAYSTITPNEGYAFPTLQEFFGMIVLDEDDEFETDGNLIYVNQSTEEETIYSFFFESANSFWWVQFEVDVEDVTPADALAKFKEWANNITITDAAE